MTREEQLSELMQQIAEQQLKFVPANISDSFSAIAGLQARVMSLMGQVNLLYAFITSTPDSKKVFRGFVKLVANADVPKEHPEMYQAARMLDLMYPETDDPQSPGTSQEQRQSQPSFGDNVILFPGFPRKDPKK